MKSFENKLNEIQGRIDWWDAKAKTYSNDYMRGYCKGQADALRDARQDVNHLQVAYDILHGGDNDGATTAKLGSLLDVTG